MKYEKGTFSLTPNKDQMKYKPAEMQSIFFWLCEHADDRGQCYPARRTLAKECGIGLKSLDKYTQQLIDDGFITKELRRKPGTKEMMSNLYQILIMPRLVAKKDKPSAESDDTSSIISDNITIPTINNNHLTEHTVTDVTDTKEEIDTLNRLPPKYGSTTLIRLIKVYNALWRQTYGSAPGLTNIGRFGKAVNKVLAEHTEMQVAVLIHTYYHWYGGSGNDQKEHNYLVDAGFPIEMILNKVGIMIAYLTNNIGLDYTDPEKVKAYAVRNLKDVL